MFHAGDHIGPYLLLRQLGVGGMGVVWLAEKQGKFITTQVALKFPLSDGLDLPLFRQEVQTWQQASGHPNVLPLLDAEEYDGKAVLVSEYAPDGSVLDWIKRYGGKAPSVAAALAMIDGVLAGLEHLHERGIVHRDLKPANILLTRETPRLTDFGISRVLRTTSYTTQRSGTPSFMAPENFDGKFSPKSDIWAVGVLLYQLLCGRMPFPQEQLAPLMKAILNDAPVPLPADVPINLRRILARVLAKDPAKRYTASEMRSALRQIVSTDSHSLSGISEPALALSEVTQVDVNPPVIPIPSKFVPDTRMGFILFLLALPGLLTVLAVLTLSWLQPDTIGTFLPAASANGIDSSVSSVDASGNGVGASANGVDSSGSGVGASVSGLDQETLKFHLDTMASFYFLSVIFYFLSGILCSIWIRKGYSRGFLTILILGGIYMGLFATLIINKFSYYFLILIVPDMIFCGYSIARLYGKYGPRPV